ncbi:MAG: cytochrome c oxidase subunit II [Anaerolineae bacterium]|nr:cytochrome c oxidase subunit II [Anaerolineae bacterium]
MRVNRIGTIIVIGVVLCVAGVIVGFTVNWLPVQASAEASSIDTLFRVMLSIATVVFLIVELGIVYSILRFRRKPGDDSDGPPEHGNTALEITWTAIPAVIVFILTIYSYKVFADTQAPQQNETVIGVTGQQFAWTFTYPYEPFAELTAEQNEMAKNNMISNELHVPSGRPVRVDIHALDVMHGFYIPEFRIKQDAIPGRVTTARFTPTEKGQFQVICSELCGEGHAKMSMQNMVFVEDQAQYDKFVADMRARAREAATNPRLPARGRQLMAQKYACGSCHTLTDDGLTGVVGPTLDGVATRAANNVDDRLTKSGVANAEEYLRLSIVNPGTYLVPGYQNLMPKNFGDPNVMPEDDREAIINYLLTQK